MSCNAEYCSKNPSYSDYKSFDANQDYRVRILLIAHFHPCNVLKLRDMPFNQ